MAVIAPFRGILYNPAKITDMSKVVAPPYDVISPEGQEKLYQRSNYNIVRLDFGKELPSDNLGNNRYTRAAAEFERWQREGALTRDDKPAIYAYEQEYRLKDATVKTRKGFMSLIRLEDFDSGVILPHERTLSGPKTDRLNLMKACESNFSPIFSLYSDPVGKTNSLLSEASNEQPLISIRGEDGVVNRLWRVTNTSVINSLLHEMADKMIFIADGHHRYETALTYRDEMRQKNPGYSGKEAYNYTLMYFSNMDDEGLTVFPTHRLIFGVRDFDAQTFETKLSGEFEVEKVPVPDSDELFMELMEHLREKGRNRHSFGVYAEGWNHFLLISLKDEGIMDNLVTEHSAAYRTLDVTILHTLVIENILGINREKQEKKENIEYVQDEWTGLSKVREGDRQVLFILNPTKVKEVEDVAKAKDKMPQKSTYFYPKLLTGLVINKIDGNI